MQNIEKIIFIVIENNSKYINNYLSNERLIKYRAPDI